MSATVGLSVSSEKYAEEKYAEPDGAGLVKRRRFMLVLAPVPVILALDRTPDDANCQSASGRIEMPVRIGRHRVMTGETADADDPRGQGGGPGDADLTDVCVHFCLKNGRAAARRNFVDPIMVRFPA
ncbi:MAG: hypothetical protein AB7O80_14465 [Acetobacteraceae bacterium]